MESLFGFVRDAIKNTLRRGLWIGGSLPFSWTGYKNVSYKYFQDDEIKGLDATLVLLLDRARERAGVPFVITSGKRSPGDNATVGGVQDSAHLSGLAVDLRADDHHTRGLIVKSLYLEGATRLGVYRNSFGDPTHVHVDISTTLPQNELWDGVSH